MSYNYLLIENSNTLSYFDYLLENKQNPKLALYKNESLVLLSYEPKNFFEYADLLWIKIKNFVLNIFSPVLEDEKKIEIIRKKIDVYHFSKLDKVTIESYFKEYMESCTSSQDIAPYEFPPELKELQNKTMVNLEKIAKFLEETGQTDKL